MINIRFVLPIMTIALMSMTIVASCTGGSISMKTSIQATTDSSATHATDTLWNDEVQSEFFDAKFGDPADSVIANFSNYGFILLDKQSDDNTLIFGHKSEYYSFSDMRWVNLTVNLTDGKFSSISFYTPRQSKAEALKDFDQIIDNISKKYKLTNVEPDDTTMYKLKRAYTKSALVAGVGCYSYFDQDSVRFYTTSLDFTDTKLFKETDDQ